MAEAQRVVAAPLDELADPLPAVDPADVAELVAEELAHQVEVEAGAHDRGDAQEQPVLRLERVDPLRHQPLDRLGQLSSGAAADRGDELAHEERVTARAGDERLERVLGERELAVDHPGERGSQLGRQGLEREHTAVLRVVGDEGGAARAPRHADQPGLLRGLLREVQQELA